MLLTVFGMLNVFTNLSLVKFLVRFLTIFFLFLSNWTPYILLSYQDTPVNTRVSRGSISFSLFPLYIKDLPDDAVCNICNITTFDDTTF